MAKAPTPGATRKKTERQDSAASVDIFCDGKTYVLNLPLPTGEQRALRVETGLTIDRFLHSPSGAQALGLDSVSVFLWLARRQQGEKALRLDEVDAVIDKIADACGTDAGALDKRLRFEFDVTDDTDPEG